MDELDLLDWKRHVFSAYADVRSASDPPNAWRRWRAARDALFREHPQSPLPAVRRDGFAGLTYFGYDPGFRVLGAVDPAAAAGDVRDVAAGGGEAVRFRRFAVVRFELGGVSHGLALFWLEAYGGGVFLPFADATSGNETYGGGRYDPRWACPLSPPENRLPVAVRAGETHPARSSAVPQAEAADEGVGVPAEAQAVGDDAELVRETASEDDVLRQERPAEQLDGLEHRLPPAP